MSGYVRTPEQQEAASERMRARWAAMSPEKRAAHLAKFRPKDPSANAHRQMLEFWAGCTGEARAKRCAHLTNPEAQAKSHAAQRTPEFRKRRSAWAKAAWERMKNCEGLTPEEIDAAIAAKRKAVGQFLAEQRRKRRIGVVPIRKEASSPAYPVTVGEIRAREWEAAVHHLVVGNKLIRRQMPIVSFENETGEIVRYGSIPDAARELVAQGRTASAGSARMTISLVCNGHRRTALGRVWCYDWERCGVSATGRMTCIVEWEKGIKWLKYRKKHMLEKTGKRPVIGFRVRDAATPSVLRFPSIIEAAAECVRLGLSKSASAAAAAICQSLGGRSKTAFGFVWSYDWGAIPLPRTAALRPKNVNGVLTDLRNGRRTDYKSLILRTSRP